MNDQEAKRNAQNHLLETFPGSTAWNFIDRLEKIWETTDEITYADVENISYKDDKSLMWLLIDHCKSQEIDNKILYKSSKVLYEYNCTESTRRAIMFRLFESAMGNGRCVYDSGILENESGPVPTIGNVGYKAWEIACKLNPNNVTT